jgi:hypothetical protein
MIEGILTIFPYLAIGLVNNKRFLKHVLPGWADSIRLLGRVQVPDWLIWAV